MLRTPKSANENNTFTDKYDNSVPTAEELYNFWCLSVPGHQNPSKIKLKYESNYYYFCDNNADPCNRLQEDRI